MVATNARFGMGHWKSRDVVRYSHIKFREVSKTISKKLVVQVEMVRQQNAILNPQIMPMKIKLKSIFSGLPTIPFLKKLIINLTITFRYLGELSPEVPNRALNS